MIITCRQLVEKVTDARERTLGAVDRIGWAAHLARCRHCRRYVQQMDATVAALRAARAHAPAETAPPDVRAAVLAAAAAATAPPRRDDG